MPLPKKVEPEEAKRSADTVALVFPPLMSATRVCAPCSGVADRYVIAMHIDKSSARASGYQDRSVVNVCRGHTQRVLREHVQITTTRKDEFIEAAQLHGLKTSHDALGRPTLLIREGTSEFAAATLLARSCYLDVNYTQL
jgi:hypothetical protein